MEKRLTGIVIAAKDYKDKDKLLTLLTVEQGLINVIVKGVKYANAKLKYAKELFTFGYFDVVVNGGFVHILTSCEVIDNFENIKYNPDKYIELSNITNIIRDIAQYNDYDSGLMLEYLEAIKALNYSHSQHNIICLRFLISIFSGLGYKLYLDKCAVCREELSDKIYINIETGEIVCERCRHQLSLQITKMQFDELKQISQLAYDELDSTKFDAINALIKILVENYKFKVNEHYKFYY